MMKEKQTKLLTRQCKVCNAPAQYAFFGVVSCHSCKMFFRRNANSKKKYLPCNFDGHCEINNITRHICSSCRLAKCFHCGMKTDRFRPSRKTTSIKLPNPYQSKQSLSLNGLQTILTDNQWELLSNLYHSYNESQLFAMGRHLHNIHHTHVTFQTLAKKFLTLIYDTTARYLRVNNELCKLPFNDRSIVLRTAADNVACMTSVFSMKYCRLYNLNDFLQIMKTKYGKYTIDIHCWAMKYIDRDIVIVKMSMALFAVSENVCLCSQNISMNLIDSLMVFHTQNRYVEVIWNYLIAKYNYYGAVKRFLNLTVCLLALKMLTAHAQSLRTHVNDIDSLVEQIELALLFDDIEQIC
ncbi:hypothetical protein I4U23_023394 [Adineta vaga]|nr:hypothetical protein I4U23_023394 [Adineta vaga]